MVNLLLQSIPFILIVLGFVTGRYIEKKHLRRLRLRESALGDIVVCNMRQLPRNLKVKDGFLVAGSVVIATDYFKVFAAGLRGLFGGELRTYRSLMSRARREALVRMLEQTKQAGAQAVWNVRFETSTIEGKRRAGGAEVLAYGTALRTE